MKRNKKAKGEFVCLYCGSFREEHGKCPRCGAVPHEEKQTSITAKEKDRIEANVLMEMVGNTGGDDFATKDKYTKKEAFGILFDHIRWMEEQAVDHYIYNLIHKHLSRDSVGTFLLELYERNEKDRLNRDKEYAEKTMNVRGKNERK